jgi:sugar/nucleoside kinase (ribokinase family)
MTANPALHVTALGNAIVDVIAPAEDGFLHAQGLAKGTMTLIDDDRAHALYGAMAAGIEASGGSAANTVAGVASLGGMAAYIGKTAPDQLGEVFAHDIRAIGARFATAPLEGGPATARCLINVTPDGQRTMATYLGAANRLGPADVDEALIRDAAVVYLEGYLFDPPPAREAFVKAAGLARAAGRKTAMTLSDVFVVDRWRDEILAFLPKIDMVFANMAELHALYPDDDFETALDKLASSVEIAAVTRSEHGSVVRRGGERHDVPAFPIRELVDTTGAGDQYAAGFLFGYAVGKPLDVCGRLGSLAAAEVIQHYGPRPQTPLAGLAREAGLL